jgi:competence protein ComEA
MKVTFFVGLLSCCMLFFTVQASNAASPPAATQTTHTININTANASLLAKSVKGIGIKRAESIVAYRTEHGPFKSLDELGNVPRIGKNFVSSHLEAMEQIFVVK